MADHFARMAFPNESAAYREARNALLDAEIALRRQTEAVAEMRRALPPGGEVPEDFAFERIGAHLRPEKVKLSELFGEHSTLLLYSYMFGPERDSPCPGCTHLLDCVEGAALHVPQRAALYVAAASPIARLAAWAHERAGATCGCSPPPAMPTAPIITATPLRLRPRCATSADTRQTRAGTSRCSTCS